MTALKPRVRVGMPKNSKPNPRSDFYLNEFDAPIVTLGYKMYWSRAGICPCLNNDQTEQADPTCSLCKGEGWYYFCPDPAIAAGSTVDQEGNEITLSPDGLGIQIQVLMTAMTQDVQIFEKFGEWTFGTARITVQAPNRLGYRDKFTAVESEMTWAQVIDYDGSDVIPIVGSRKKTGLRYPFTVVNQFRSLSTVYREKVDFHLTDQGEIEWLLGARPASGTRLSIHGSIHPVWIVMDHVHAYRDTNQVGATTAAKDQTFARLPIQSVAKLEFLVNP